MIRRNTVIVLGAGASAPYGFPLGKTLADEVSRLAQKETRAFAQTLAAVCSQQRVREFCREFQRSGQYSIDTFVQRRTEFKDIAKVGIVAYLTPMEIEENLFVPPTREDGSPGHDWYRYLLNHIVPPNPAAFSANKLKVITFNFDRSFERRLFIALQASYKLSASDTAKLAGAVPVLHIHGDLGEPAWIPQDPQPEQARPYTPVNHSSETILHFANRLKLVDEEIPKDRLETARDWVKSASEVWFMGFGYHSLNLQRLDVGRLTGVEVRCTFLGMSDGEVAKATRAFAVRPHEYRGELAENVAFLGHIGMIHED